MKYKLPKGATYAGIRKVPWDMLWHVLFTAKDKPEHTIYDRVTKEQAFTILQELDPWKGQTDE